MVIRLKKYSSDVVPKRLRETIATFRYAFNPSLVVHEKKTYLALRLYDDATKKIIAMLYFWDDEEDIQSLNLTEFFGRVAGAVKVSDPKMFVLGDKICGTFNTGYVAEGNRLAVFEVEGTSIGKYHFCDYGQRSKVEKNWAFYEKDDELFCLYSMSPFTILKAKSYEDRRIVFEKYFVDEKVFFHHYTIGTPLRLWDNEYRFVAHKKIFKRGKRLYLGRPFSFSPLGVPSLRAKRTFLLHSFRALLGDTHKFNKNLISCTYFSGLDWNKDQARLCYGINDVGWNTAVIEAKKLWP